MTSRAFATTVLLLLGEAVAHAQGGVEVHNIRLARNGEQVQLSMDVSLAAKNPDRNSVVVFTPRLVSGNDSVDFPQVAVYGRNAYYYHVRTGRAPQVGPDAYMVRHKGGPRTEHYARTLPHERWMDNSTLRIIATTGDPCYEWEHYTDSREAFTTPPPDTLWLDAPERQPQTAGTMHVVSGEAKVEFVVNRTELRPDFRGNREELLKMKSTIDEVRSDTALKVVSYRLHGYASPEGSYQNNVRLAKGRTEALRRYMTTEWQVPDDEIETDYTPEDWEGLRRYVTEHRDHLKHPDDILAIIDTDMEPDARLARLQARHPQDYRYLLANCFPALRRTDYYINSEWVGTVHEATATPAADDMPRTATLLEHEPDADDPLEPDVLTLLRPTRPWLAVKTNLLFDALLAPNIELEAQLGRDSRWSLMVEDWFPWYLYGHNRAGDNNEYRRGSHKPYRHAYELWALGAELRYWFWPRCPEARPTLTGTFAALYAAGGKYDWERHSEGDQGEFTSLGFTIGHSWVLAQSLNLELSASAGYVAGPRRHYVAEDKFQDNRLIWQYSGRTRYWGPTKLKLSLVWLLSNKPGKKGGRR